MTNSRSKLFAKKVESKDQKAIYDELSICCFHYRVLLFSPLLYS